MAVILPLEGKYILDNGGLFQPNQHQDNYNLIYPITGWNFVINFKTNSDDVKVPYLGTKGIFFPHVKPGAF